MTSRILKGVLRRIPLRLLGDPSPALTYHTCYPAVPTDLDPLDNATPERLHEHISRLKRRYRFVPVDEYCRARNRRGLATVTFDDGNKSVIDYALPVLASLDTPFAVFVTLLGPERRVFWRFKVLLVMREGLERECEASFRGVQPLPGISFRQYTKHARNNSKTVEQEVDRFLESRGLACGPSDYFMDAPRYFEPHPLVWLGNHSAHHYVLGSLSRSDQEEEIGLTRTFLNSLEKTQRSEVFAAPFGEERHINDDTLAVLRDMGYRYLLVNRGGVNRDVRSRFGIEIVERFSALDEDIAWQLRRHCLRDRGAFAPAQ